MLDPSPVRFAFVSSALAFSGRICRDVKISILLVCQSVVLGNDPGTFDTLLSSFFSSSSSALSLSLSFCFFLLLFPPSLLLFQLLRDLLKTGELELDLRRVANPHARRTFAGSQQETGDWEVGKRHHRKFLSYCKINRY